MTSHDDRADAHIDAALEAMARPEPPPDHVARVLARTTDAGAGRDASLRRPSPSPWRPSPSPWRPPPLPLWAIPVAASVPAALVLVWQVARGPVILPAVAEVDGSAAAEMDGSASRPYQPWLRREEIVGPVLPPQAYWGMDAFEEWRSLRPGSGSRVPGAGDQEPDPRAGGRVIDRAADAVAARGLAPAGTPRSQAAEDELAWAPVPSGLPEIELSSIVPAPLEVVPLDEPPPITLSEITLEPIELGPFDEQEKP